MKAILLGGGYAKRLWPLTSFRPKPLLPIAGKPIIDYILDDIKKIKSIEKIYLSTNKAFEGQFKKWLQRGKTDKKIELVVEETKSEEEKLGAIKAIYEIVKKKRIKDEFLLITADNLLSFDISDFIKSFDGNFLVAIYDIKDISKATMYGVVQVDENKIIDFQEKPTRPKSTLVSTGCYLFPKNSEKLFKEYFNQENPPDAPGYFLKWLCQREPVKVFIFKDDWYDIGDRDSYIKANLSRLDGNKIETNKVKHSRIRNSYIGKDAVIKNSVVVNCIIFDNTTIINSALKNCIVDSKCAIVNLDLNDSIVGCYTHLEKKKLLSSRKFILPPVTGTELL